MGSPARDWATPMVKGLQTPAAKPQPAAKRLIPSPVTASQPKLTASATTMGTKGTHSSKLPMKAPIAMKNRGITARRVYFVWAKRCTKRCSMYCIRPQTSSALKTPPMTSRNAMMAQTIPPPSAPSTRMGLNSHLLKGRPPSIYRKLPWDTMTVLPLSSKMRAYSPEGMINVNAYVPIISNTITAIAPRKDFTLTFKPLFSCIKKTPQ